MKNLKWKNVIKLLILAFCLGVMITDCITLVITMGGFTAYGVLTFVLCCLCADYIISDFENQTKSVSRISTIGHTK